MTLGTRQKWEGRWQQLKGKVKCLWGRWTANERLRSRGDSERLLGVITARRGTKLERLFLQ